MRVRHPKRDAKLSLDEQLVLLALDVSFGPESAKIYSKSLDVGVAGAILFLLLRNGGGDHQWKLRQRTGALFPWRR